MPGFISTYKLAAAVVIAAAMLTATSTPSSAETCSIRLKIVKAGFIVGVGGGSGTLTCHGRRYPLSVGGIGVGSLGVAAVNLGGTAKNLRTPADIAGSYAGVGTGATFVGGGQVATLQNEKGVVLQVHGAQMGFQVSLGLAGMTLAMQ
jgi:hypothetical protein